MNTTASYSSEHSWSRRCSTETIFSIQGKETDVVCDTSDTEWCENVSEGEYEPQSEQEDAAPLSPTSSHSDNDIISTRVIAVSVGDDGELQLADSEMTASDGSDSEMDLYDFWHCAQCNAENNNPLYRYCEKCFKVRKNFFPPRPKRRRRKDGDLATVPRTLSQDSGVDSAANSQDLANSQNLVSSQNLANSQTTSILTDSQHTDYNETPKPTLNNDVILNKPLKRRRAESLGSIHNDTDSENENQAKRTRQSKSADVEIIPLVKTISDPSLTIDETVKITTKTITETVKEKLDGRDDLCIVCCAEPKSGVFVHGRIAHICCCYKCAVKVWTTLKRCPVCNCKVSNVLKAVVM